MLTSATWPRRCGGGPRGEVEALLAALRLPAPAPEGATPASAAALWGVRLAPPRTLPCDRGTPLAAGAAVLGRTCVFIKDGATLGALELCRAAALSGAAVVGQALWRGHAARAQLARAARRVALVQALWRAKRAARAWAALKRAAARVGAWARGCLVRARHGDERGALGLLRGAGGKPRTATSMRWGLSGEVDWAGVLRAGAPPGLAAAVKSRLRDPRELLFSAPALKLRLEKFAVVPRVVVLVGGEAPALLTFAPGARKPATVVPLSNICGLWLSPVSDDFCGVLCDAARRQHPLVLLTPLKSLLAKCAPPRAIFQCPQSTLNSANQPHKTPPASSTFPSSGRSWPRSGPPRFPSTCQKT